MLCALRQAYTPEGCGEYGRGGHLKPLRCDGGRFACILADADPNFVVGLD